jgi:hypothetical protein
MAERPIFVPAISEPELVKEIYFDIHWNSGFAPIQKEKNIKALHECAAKAGYSPLLEISTKSAEKVGRHLSAFHLKVRMARGKEIPLECVFQGSKVFENGGPYTDLYSAEMRFAKRDPRLTSSGHLIGFEFGELKFPLEPKTVFYDWLYLNAVFPHRKWLTSRLRRFIGFTDIEFNPHRSISCQARSCALFVTLNSRHLLEDALESPSAFIKLLSDVSYRPNLIEESTQKTLFTV